MHNNNNNNNNNITLKCIAPSQPVNLPVESTSTNAESESSRKRGVLEVKKQRDYEREIAGPLKDKCIRSLRENGHIVIINDRKSGIEVLPDFKYIQDPNHPTRRYVAFTIR